MGNSTLLLTQFQTAFPSLNGEEEEEEEEEKIEKEKEKGEIKRQACRQAIL